MRIVDIIARKRAGAELTAAEVEDLVLGYARGDVPDYQVAAWLMAACLRGLSLRETVDLTAAIVRSGSVVDWSECLPFVVDKHSSGGVGDKTSLVVAPLVAAAGVPVAKMSGRGLGFTGGTLDKLESIPGLCVYRSPADLKRQVERIGLAIIAQSPDLAPADGKLYALRDATATVDYLPLIASSIMSKKIASGANGIVLDVKAGRGAFMRTVGEAEELAEWMLNLGNRAGRRVRAVISAMDSPLGQAVGNALEVKEAVKALRGEGPTDLMELSLALGSQMLLLANQTAEEEEARRLLLRALRSGAALAKMREMVAAQGGDVRALDDTRLLPASAVVHPVRAPRAGYVAAVDARRVAEMVVRLGGGRARKEDAIDHTVGVLLHAKPGAFVAAGDRLCDIHAADEASAAEAAASVLTAYSWSDIAPEEPSLVLETLG